MHDLPAWNDETRFPRAAIQDARLTAVPDLKEPRPMQYST